MNEEKAADLISGPSLSRRIQKQVLDKIFLVAASLFFVLAVFIWVAVQPDVFPALKGVPAPQAGDPERLKAHVRMLSQTLSYRDFLEKENLEKSASYIEKQFQAAGWRTRLQEFEVEGNHFKNIIANFGSESKDRIVVGAHYDAYDELPGADDNASGVAGVLELARLIGSAKPPMTAELEFVAWCLEEPPYFGTEKMGSHFHSQLVRSQGVTLRAMISVEMIGYFTDAPHSQSFPLSVAKLLYPSAGNFIAVVGGLTDRGLILKVKKAMQQAGPVPVWSMSAPWWIGTGASDQWSYWSDGFSGVMVTDTAYLRNHAYHSKDDTWDRLDYVRMSQVVGELDSAVVGLAQ